MSSVFIKRYPSRKEFPETAGYYDTNVGRVFYVNEIFDRPKKYYPSWWLQEIELPSEKDIKIKNMQKEFVSYELAVKLKELGFDERCLAYYLPTDKSFVIDSFNDVYEIGFGIKSPLWQQAFDFFRLEMGIDSWIHKTYDCYNINIVRMDDDFEGNEDLTDGLSFKDFKIYEQARQACLEKLIQILENENKTNTN